MPVLDPRRASVFGAYAEDYERWRPGYPDEALDWLLPVGASRVADVGAGTGKLTGPLLARGLQVAAIEPDPRMLAVLRRRHPAAEAHLAGAAELPLPDASVDAVLVGQAWHWFPPDAATAEVRRVLRPGGRLGLIWNGFDPRDPWELELTRLDPDSRDLSAARADDTPDVPGLPGAELELASFPWADPITAADLRARLATQSAFVIMAAEERGRLLDAMAALLAAEAERRGTPTVPLHLLADCVRWQPDPRPVRRPAAVENPAAPAAGGATGDRFLTVMIADVPAPAVAVFQEYESRVLPLLGRHGGRLERRLRGSGGQVEVHLVSFDTRSGYESYLADPERTGHRQLLAGADITQRVLELDEVRPPGAAGTSGRR